MSIAWGAGAGDDGFGGVSKWRGATAKLLMGLLTVVPMGMVLVWVLATLGPVKGLSFEFPVASDSDDSPEGIEKQETLWRTFNLHPVCMTLAFSCLFAEALLVFKFLPVSWRVRKFVHAGLQLGALVFSSLGIATVVKFKQAYSQEHLYSEHSWFGVVTYAAFAIQFTIGAVFLLRPRWFVRFFPEHESYVRTVLPWHILAGQTIYFGATLSLVTGVLDRESLFRIYDGVHDLRGPRFVLGNLIGFAVAALSYAVFLVHSRNGSGSHLSGDDYYRSM